VDEDVIRCENCPAPATWLMGAVGSISLDWPFLCDQHKAEEVANLERWPEDMVITWDPIDPS
jgi:hypothetical protein